MEQSILVELQYLPPIQFFSKLVKHPKVWIEQHENYSKGSYRNRCHLASAQGLLRLSIPLEGGKHQQQPIKEVRISNKENWQHQHWTAIKSAYGKSPFFEYYADGFFPIYKKKYTHLWEWNWDLLQQVLAYIPFENEIELTTQYDKHPSDDVLDFRNKISPKAQKNFEDTSFSPVKYNQVFEERHEFLANMSILDLLFCKGPEVIVMLERSVR